MSITVKEDVAHKSQYSRSWLDF